MPTAHARICAYFTKSRQKMAQFIVYTSQQHFGGKKNEQMNGCWNESVGSIPGTLTYSSWDLPKWSYGMAFSVNPSANPTAFSLNPLHLEN